MKHYDFVADERHEKYGLVPGERYAAKMDENGRTVGKPILIGHVPTLREQLSVFKMNSRVHDNVPETDERLVRWLETGTVGMAALIVVMLGALVIDVFV